MCLPAKPFPPTPYLQAISSTSPKYPPIARRMVRPYRAPRRLRGFWPRNVFAEVQLPLSQSLWLCMRRSVNWIGHAGAMCYTSGPYGPCTTSSTPNCGEYASENPMPPPPPSPPSSPPPPPSASCPDFSFKCRDMPCQQHLVTPFCSALGSDANAISGRILRCSAMMSSVMFMEQQHRHFRQFRSKPG